jgi:SAM-dependent methyltransferase
MSPPTIARLHRALHAALIQLRYAGQCNVCAYVGCFRVPLSATDNLRESLHCPRCRSISRDRFLALVLAWALDQPPLMTQWRPAPHLVVREPSGFRGRAAALTRLVDYRPIRWPAESLEALEDADESVDGMVTSDVFEHVRRDDLAFREVFRVLKPGGWFFLQVPYCHAEHTRVLVGRDGDADVCLAPRVYHAERTLVYRIYGHDLMPALESIGFSVAWVHRGKRRYGLPRLDMIVGRKAAGFPNDRRYLVGFTRELRV